MEKSFAIKFDAMSSYCEASNPFPGGMVIVHARGWVSG